MPTLTWPIPCPIVPAGIHRLLQEISGLPYIDWGENPVQTAQRLGVGNATTEYRFLDNYKCAAPRPRPHTHTHTHTPCIAAAACQQHGSMQP